MPAGAKPGERRGGRAKGALNKATMEIKAVARQYAPDAIKELARLAKKAKSEAARVAACREILDRACGKPAQPITGKDDGPITVATIDTSKLNEEQLRVIGGIAINDG